ncbi:MAG: nucleotide exchange factor GrpE [Candidatus Delongbacteria bacterium]
MPRGKKGQEDFEINRSEIFNSDYYFDDIIEELTESGLYSEDGISSKLKSEEIKQNSNELGTKIDDVKQDINQRIQKIEQKVLNANEMLFNMKNELLQTIQKMQNSLLLMKFETEEGITKINDAFKEKFAGDCVKEKAFEELYSQLDSYKKNFVFSTIKPLIHDLLLFYDRIENDIENSAETGGEECKKLKTFRDEILEILYRNDVTPVEKTPVGEKFNPEKSNAVDKFETDDESLDNTVRKVLKLGFRKGNVQIRPEMVQIFKLNSKQAH